MLNGMLTLPVMLQCGPSSQHWGRRGEVRRHQIDVVDLSVWCKPRKLRARISLTTKRDTRVMFCERSQVQLP